MGFKNAEENQLFVRIADFALLLSTPPSNSQQEIEYNFDQLFLSVKLNDNRLRNNSQR